MGKSSDMEQQIPADDESGIRDALRAVEERFRSLAEHSRSFLFQCNPDRTITYCSPAVDRSIGFTPEEMTGTGLKSYFPTEALPGIDRASGEILSEKGPKSLEIIVLCKNGSLLPVEMTLSPLSEGERIAGIQKGVARNITDRKRLERELIDLEARHGSLLDKLPVAVPLTSVQGELIYLNEVATRTLGYESTDEYLPEGVLALYKNLAEREKTMGILRKTGKLESYPLDIVSRSGVKEIATQLRPKVLDDLGLAAAIERQSNRFQERTGIFCKVKLRPEEIILDQDLSTDIFRILQETLTNIARHADATRIDVSLLEKTDQIVLEVLDNGKGITSQDISSPHSIGLLGMKQRVYPWNGEVAFLGKEGKGTTVTVTIPRERSKVIR